MFMFTVSVDVKRKRDGIRDWSLIMRRGGLQNRKIAGPNPPPPPQDRVKPPPPPHTHTLFFEGWEFCAPPPYQYGQQNQAPVLKLSQNLLCPPFSNAKTFPPSSHFFVGLKLHPLPPPPTPNPSCFVAPPPPPPPP